MKAVRNIFRVLTAILAVGVVAHFFFKFVTVGFEATDTVLNLTGAQLAFGADVSTVFTGFEAGTLTVFKSGWYLVAFIAAAFNVLFAFLGFKSKGASIGSILFGLFGGIVLTVIALSSPGSYIDLGLVAESFPASTYTYGLLLYTALGAFYLSVVTAIIGALVNDRMEVLASNGKKVGIFTKIKLFFKDYKAELKKIVWPNAKSVVKNTIVVLVMCLIVGAFIWLVDWGLSEGVKVIFTDNTSSTTSESYELSTSSQAESETDNADATESAAESVADETSTVEE